MSLVWGSFTGRRSPSGSTLRLAWALCVALALVACDTDSGETPLDAGTDTSPVDAGPTTLTDPLSMPAEPTVALEAFSGSQMCANCHPQHRDEWRTSSHAYAMVDPVFRALVDLRQAERDGREDRFCTQCHSNIGVRSGDVAPNFDWDALAPITLEGVTCESCHRVSGVERAYNSGHVLDPTAPMAGTIADPVTSDFHESRYAPEMGESRFCAGCHDVVEVSGVNLERPFAEWTESPALASGTQCQDCHMPERSGVAAMGGPERTVHSHRFVGVALPLKEDFITEPSVLAEMETDILALLATAAELAVETTPTTTPAGTQLDTVVTVHNRIAGHNLPTGTTFLRQLWLAITATDANGTVLYETGQLDGQGDLLDFFSEELPHGDPDLVLLSSRLVDARGEPTLFPWRAVEHISASIPPLHHRTATFFVPVDGAVGPVTITVRLRFRSIAPYLLRAIGLGHLVERVVIRDLATVTRTVEL